MCPPLPGEVACGHRIGDHTLSSARLRRIPLWDSEKVNMGVGTKLQIVDGKPVLDQNSLVKTSIVPYNHKSSRLLIRIREKHCVNSIQKSERMAGVVRTQCGIVMEDPVLSDGSTRSYITPTLSMDIGNCPLSYSISPP